MRRRILSHPARLQKIVAGWLAVAAYGVPWWGGEVAATPPPQKASAWRTGKALERQLEAPAGVRWSGMPLSRGITSLASSQQVAMLLDRRIDPGKRVSLELDGQSLRETLERIAAQADAGVTVAGPVVYWGPRHVAARLRTVLALRREQVNALPLASRAPFLKSEPLRWEKLAAPREILNGLAQTADISIKGAEKIPHDLWRAGDLPPLSWIDRLSLVLVGFDLTFQICSGGKSVELVPLEEPIALTRPYFIPPAQLAAVREVAQRDSAQLTSTEIANRLVLTARVETHEAVQAILAGRRAADTPSNPSIPGTTPAREVYTLSIENKPLRPVLRELAKQTGLEIRWDEEGLRRSGRSLETLVSVSVRQVGREELLAAVLASAGLRFTRDGESFVVTAIDP